ncbi:14566_t:CDS:1, partial [Gigaspora rosea]
YFSLIYGEGPLVPDEELVNTFSIFHNIRSSPGTGVCLSS